VGCVDRAPVGPGRMSLRVIARARSPLARSGGARSRRSTDCRQLPHWSLPCLNRCDFAAIPGKPSWRSRAGIRGFAGISGRFGGVSNCLPCRGRGFESLQPLQERPAFAGLFARRVPAVRLRHRTMTGQSCPWRLADAVGRCSLAGDSERPAPWNFCVPAEDRDRPRRVGAPTPPAPLRLVRGRSACLRRRAGLFNLPPARRRQRQRRQPAIRLVRPAS
jgi:hypothetical protein